MATSDTAKLDVRVTHTRSEQTTGYAAPENFWRPLFERGKPPVREMPPIPAMEEHVTHALPRHLRNELTRYFALGEPVNAMPAAGPVRAERAADALPRVGIRVRSISYGSLDLSVEFAGLQHLVGLFDANVDLFLMFASSYVPAAFAATLQELGAGLPGELRYELSASPGLMAAFMAPVAAPVAAPAPAPAPAPSPPPAPVPSPPAAPQATTAALDRAKALWQISNFSLVVPVALALLVLYVYAKSLADDRRDLKAWQTSLAAREQVQARATQERIAQLEKVQGELLVLAKDAGARPPEKKK